MNAAKQNQPTARGSGPINADMIERYRVIAVFPLKDDPDAPGSGAPAASMIVGQLAGKGFTVIDRTHIDRLFEEQRLQLIHGDEQKIQLKVGRLVGASAIIVGEVRRGMSGTIIKPRNNASLASDSALAVRLIDVETGIVLFSGEAEFPQTVVTSSQSSEQALARLIVSRLAQKVGLESSGKPGFNWDLESYSNQLKYVVREFEADSPAYQAGLRSGDVILSCNGSASETWKTLWDSMRRCRAEVGEALRLEVRRSGKVLAFSFTTGENNAVSSDR